MPRNCMDWIRIATKFFIGEKWKSIVMLLFFTVSSLALLVRSSEWGELGLVLDMLMHVLKGFIKRNQDESIKKARKKQDSNQQDFVTEGYRRHGRHLGVEDKRQHWFLFDCSSNHPLKMICCLARGWFEPKISSTILLAWKIPLIDFHRYGSRSAKSPRGAEIIPSLIDDMSEQIAFCTKVL